MLKFKSTRQKFNFKGNEMKNISNRGRYELFINGIYIGRFASIKSLMTVGLKGQCVRSIHWNDSVCKVVTDESMSR